MIFRESLLEEFITEAREHLENAEEDLLKYADSEEIEDEERIDRIFRCFHSIKGAAGFLRLSGIEKVTHALESILSGIRSGRLEMNRKSLDEILAGIDTLGNMLDNVLQSDNMDVSDLVSRITALTQLDEAEPESVDARKIKFPDSNGNEILFRVSAEKIKRFHLEHQFFMMKFDLHKMARKDGKNPVVVVNELLDHGEILDANLLSEARDLREEITESPLQYYVFYATKQNGSSLAKLLGLKNESVIQVDSSLVFDKGEDPETGSKETMNAEKLPSDDTDEPYPEKKQDTTSIEPKQKKKVKLSKNSMHSGKAGATGIRIDLQKIDHLVNLIGELAIAESMVTKNPDLSGLELENFESASKILRRIISELQDTAMSLRMVPLTSTFRKMSRLVYSMSEKLKKICRLEILGEDTELDKQIIEQITDPLIHILRNSLDHGIEPPSERTGKGKPESGLIRIEAFHQGGEVVIRIEDDGKGLDRNQILKKAFEKGLLKETDRDLSDDELFQFIFSPGFSTVEELSDVSGRGVGLDVVQGNLEKLKGRVGVRSSPGKGTSFILRVPLTMAIIDGMIVRVGTFNYTIPMLSVRKSFQPDQERITKTMDGQELVKIRKELVPVLRLHEFYELRPDQTELEKGILIHVQSGNRSICLFVDEILGHHHTVIKKLPGYIASAKGVSGCTILSSGEVSLILEIGSIIDQVEAGLLQLQDKQNVRDFIEKLIQ